MTGTTSHGPTTVNAMTDSRGGLNTSVPVPDGFQGSMSVKVTVGSAAASATVAAGGSSNQDPANDAGTGTLAKPACTVTADVGGSIPDVGPGDVVCLTGETSSRLTISAGGAEGSPITYAGGGAKVQGIDVLTSNVVVEGFASEDGASMGARLQGNNITFQNNKIEHPVYAGDDTDGIRFFGDGIKIIHNDIADVYNGSHCDQSGCGDGPHPDCMQTFYSDQYPTSSDITIEGNNCKNIAAQCVIAEGPVIPAEKVNGPGQSLGWTIYDNSCDTGAAQAIQLKDIKNATIVGNFFHGSNNKGIALSDASTGAHVGGNKLSSGIGKLITFDDGQEAPGYLGPTPDQ